MSLLIRVYVNSWLIWIFLLLCRTLDASFVPSSKEQLLSGRDQCSDIACGTHSVLFSSRLKLSCCYGLILMVPKGPHANVWVTNLCCYQEIVEPSKGQGLVEGVRSQWACSCMGYQDPVSNPCFLAAMWISCFCSFVCTIRPRLTAGSQSCYLWKPLKAWVKGGLSIFPPWTCLSGTCHSSTMQKHRAQCFHVFTLE